MCLFVMEFRFDAMLCSNLGKFLMRAILSFHAGRIWPTIYMFLTPDRLCKQL